MPVIEYRNLETIPFTEAWEIWKAGKHHEMVASAFNEGEDAARFCMAQGIMAALEKAKELGLIEFVTDDDHE